MTGTPRGPAVVAARAAMITAMRADGATIAQMAAELAVTERTVSRYITDLGLTHVAAAHGTSRRYDEGCHCPACREAHRIANATYRERRRNGGRPGTSTPMPSATATALDLSSARAQHITAARATRSGQEWTSAELEVALDPLLSTGQAAAVLHRSAAAVAHQRHRNPGWRTTPRG